MLAYAGRYGHQPVLQMVGPVTVDHLTAFSEGLEHWLRREKESGGTSTMTEYAAGGGG